MQLILISSQEYTTALQYTRAFLQIEPSNHQVATLEALVKKKLEAGEFSYISHIAVDTIIIRLLSWIKSVVLEEHEIFQINSIYFFMN